MKKKNNCCLYAVLAAVFAMMGLGLLWDYDFGDWSLFSWLGALAIIVAVLVCARCRQSDEREE
jgi:hypothetical protein